MDVATIVAAGRVVLGALYFFDFCFGFSQITVNCLVTTVISLTFWHSHYVEVLSRYSFMSVLSIITVRFVCAGWITARHHDSLSIHAWQCSSRYGVHAPIAAGPANAEHVHNTAINEVTPIWAVLWYDTVRDRAFQFGQKKIRFDSRYRIDFFDSIRFGNMINLPLVHWYSDSKLGVIFIVFIA